MSKLLLLAFLIIASQVQANQTYFLTPEEVAAGFAIRDSDSQEDKAALANPSETGSEASETAVSSLTANAASSTGGGTSAGISAAAAKAKAALSSAMSALTTAAPAIAKIAVAAAVAVAVTPTLIKVAKGVLAAAVTGVCYWLGLSVDASLSAGIAAPMAVESAGGWLKGKLLRIAS
jgi:hypothetical protein